MEDSFSIPSQWIAPLVMSAVAAILILVALRLLSVMRSNSRTAIGKAGLRLSLDGFPLRTLPVGSPRLEMLHVSAQLPLVVIAPVGKNKKLPDAKVLPHILDRAIPGLREVLCVHETKVIVWPTQMSASGFRERFFHQVNLPGERGKGSDWSAAAGCFSTAGQRFALGLALHSDQPNNLGQVSIERDAQWIDMIRVRKS